MLDSEAARITIAIIWPSLASNSWEA
jgi:hypothetical protein